jgi:hypothetical protein
VNDFDERRKKEVPELDRRVLDAARREQPPTELSARMAGALGLSTLAVQAAADRAAAAQGTSQPESPHATPEAIPQTTGAALEGSTTTSGAGSLWASWVPWGAGVVALAIGGTFAARQMSNPARSAEVTNIIAAPAIAAPPIAASSVAESPTGVSPPLTTGASHDPRSSVGVSSPASGKPTVSLSGKTNRPAHDRSTSDLSEEIARMDAARGAMAAGSHARALDMLRRYESEYPAGNFRPEATALRVECLVKLGRTSEARSLAERFVRQHRGSRLAERVAQLAGIEAP